MSFAITAAATAAVGAGVSAYGASEQASAANAANAANYKSQQQQAALEQLMNAQAIRSQQAARHTPYYTQRYVPGKGWVTELTPVARQLFDLSNQVSRDNLMEQSVMRAEQARERSRRNVESGVANSLLDRFLRDSSSTTPHDYESLMRRGNVGATNEAFNQAENQATLRLARQGSDPTALAAALGKQRAEAERQSIGGIPMMARQQFENSKSARDASNMNLYNVMASRAGNITGAPFQPFNVQGQAAGDLMSQANALGNAYASRKSPGAPQMGASTNAYDDIGRAIAGVGYMGGGLADVLANRQRGSTGSTSGTGTWNIDAIRPNANAWMTNPFGGNNGRRTS